MMYKTVLYYDVMPLKLCTQCCLVQKYINTDCVTLVSTLQASSSLPRTPRCSGNSYPTDLALEAFFLFPGVKIIFAAIHMFMDTTEKKWNRV